MTSEDFLLSAGFGLELDFLDRVSFRMTVGFPILNKDELRQDDVRVNAMASLRLW